MKFEGTISIDAPRDKVWASIINPHLVSQCAPGLKSLEIVEPDKLFKVVVGIGFGSVMVTFTTNVEFVELTAPDYARMRAHGTAPGSAVDVTGEMRLSDETDNKTSLAWTADVAVVGSIAGLASRMMSGLTKKLTNDFFTCFKEKIEVRSKIQA